MAIKREKVIRTAEKLVAKGKLEAAIKEYRKVLAENPNDANTLNRVGDLYARVEKFDEAVKLFSQIADQYTSDGFFVKAIAIYKKIIKLSPQSLQVYERLAELYFKQGLLNEARTQFQILADHYEKRDNATSAINIYQRMVEIDPDNPSHYLKLAKLYEAQQLTDKALRSYRQLADLFLVNGSIEEASQVYLSALDAHHKELEFVREVVGGLYEEGHEEAARKVLAKAMALNPAAKAIGRDVFSAPKPEAAEPEAAEPEAAEPEAVAEPPVGSLDQEEESGLPEEEITFGLGDAFDLPDVPGPVELEPEPAADEPVPAAAVPAPLDAGSFDQEGDDESVFTLDLDSDEPTSTQVMPPPDMVEEPDGVEIDVEIEGDTFDTAPEVSEALEQEAPEELDWSIDEPSGEEVEVELEDEEFEIAIELEAEAAEQEAAVETAAPEKAPAKPAPGAPAPETLARHEDDLLAEAKVFSKYGLVEKAEDRLRELLGIQPEHLGALALLARLELDTGRRDAAKERAGQVARIAAATASPEPWKELSQTFAKAGVALDGVTFDEEAARSAEPPAEAVDGDRFARLLEDLDETAAGMTVLPAPDEAPESVVLEPGLPRSEPAAPEMAAPPSEDLVFESPEEQPEELTLDLEPPEEPVLAVAEEGSEALEPEPAAAGDEAVGFDEDLFALDDDLLDEEPVEAASPERAPAPDRESAEEPFAEIEALMQSVARDSGFEEFIPEETSLEDLMPFEETDEETPRAEEEKPGPEEPADRVVSLVDELDLGGLGDVLPPEAAAAAGPEAPQPPSELDETGMSWLEDVAPAPAEAEQESDSIFDEEDDFFDLAAELEAEMSDDNEEIELETAQEQSLEEIIDGFKRGVAENLSSEDYDTHYNLGIAYREMGLLDEAIGEFQLASKDPRYIVDCSSMLGICFLDKGLPELAVRWYKKGLESPALDEAQALGLLYDLGSAYLSQGDNESAYRTYLEIYGMNSNYRDVAQRIQELQQVPS